MALQLLYRSLLYILAIAHSPGLSDLMTRSDYQRMFPHHNAIYSFEALEKAVARFPSFVTTGDLTTRKRELAAFLAQIAHETSNGGPGAQGGAFSWGLFYTEERGCSDGHCTQYNVSGTSPYKPVPGKTYYGRGPLQLSYTYNYGLAGEELHLPLLEKPELVSTDGTVAFTVALWFWMRAQTPKPSCHQCMTGGWQPSAEDLRLNRKPGFGMTINIINGALECRANSKSDLALRQERIDFYRYFAKMLHVEIEKDCDCVGMAPYGN